MHHISLSHHSGTLVPWRPSREIICDLPLFWSVAEQLRRLLVSCEGLSANSNMKAWRGLLGEMSGVIIEFRVLKIRLRVRSADLLIERSGAGLAMAAFEVISYWRWGRNFGFCFDGVMGLSCWWGGGMASTGVCVLRTGFKICEVVSWLAM
jgi:hypothetical protein